MRLKSLIKHALSVISLLCWVALLFSWAALASVERSALTQPEFAVGAYTEPLALKGVVRYVTAEQMRWQDVSSVVFHASWFFGALATIILLAWRNRERSNRNALSKV